MISEEMIKNAAAEADQAIRDSLPAPAKCEHKFSPLFQRKMCRSFRMVKHPVIYKLLRYAACFVLAAALASEDVPASTPSIDSGKSVESLHAELDRQLGIEKKEAEDESAAS